MDIQHGIFSTEEKQPFFEQLLYELTIWGRDLAFTEGRPDSERIEAFKWLNEINHRILVGLKNPHYSFADLLACVRENAAQHQYLPPMIEWAIAAAAEHLHRQWE